MKELERLARYSGGQHFNWTERLQEELNAFEIVAKQKGWEATRVPTRQTNGKIKIEVGVVRFASTDEGEGHS